MNNKNNTRQESPDFLVDWKNRSSHTTEAVTCEPPEAEAPRMANGALRDAAATLQTESTHVEVSEVVFAEPTSLTFTPFRVGFSLLISSSATIRYGYESDLSRSSGIGNLLLMLPDREIHARLSPGTFRTVTCTFEKAYAESIIGSFDGISNERLLDALSVQNTLVSAIMMRLLNEASYPGELSDTVVNALGQALLVECAHWLRIGAAQPEKTNCLTAQNFELIDQRIAEANGKSPSVADLAAACGYSERHFSQLFREQINCSVGQYIKAVKITKAKGYLLETDLPLKEIAYRLGYSTPANFSYSFREATGITPAQYRKKGG